MSAADDDSHAGHSHAELNHDHSHAGHGHSHGLVDRSIVESRDDVKTVSISLAVLTTAAAIQTLIFVATGSVALLADLMELKEEDARPEDFIDLGSTVEFKVIDLEGECAQ